MTIPVLNLMVSQYPEQRGLLLDQLRDALFNVGFLYITNHGVSEEIISDLAIRVPALFSLSDVSKSRLSKLNSPHFLGYSGFAEETTQGKRDLREQYDFATELPVIIPEHASCHNCGRDVSKVYWRLQGPNQWPNEDELPGFKKALLNYHDALSELSYRFVHLVEEAFGISAGTFDHFFESSSSIHSSVPSSPSRHNLSDKKELLSPQHRLKIIKYPPAGADGESQGVGPHKDSSGWLTFLHQIGTEKGLEVLDKNGSWIPADPIAGTFVVNFGNAVEAATEGAVRATVHRVKAPTESDRYSIPFFMGLPLDVKVSEIRALIPEGVREMRRKENGQFAVEAALSPFLDPRWDSLGESVLRKWIRSHQNVGLKWYGSRMLEYYTQ